MVDSVECVVVGAGAIGLAVARSLAETGREVLVVEREALVGSVTSSRNSEVIHAGIYYPPGSRKATLCVRGKALLYAYCKDRGVPFRRSEKLIVAADESEVSALKELAANAAANGVRDLELIGGAEAKKLEPALKCYAAVLSPSTGIIDAHQYMTALEGDIAALGGGVATRSTVVSVSRPNEHLRAVIAADDGETVDIECRVLVNAAGLDAQTLASRVEGMPSDGIPTRYLAKGSYFVLSGPAPFNRLIYPLPNKASLGLHYSVDLGGQVRFGPDVQWVDALDYTVDDTRAAAFEESIRRYFPALQADALQPGYAGVRPKIVGPGEPPGDFVIQDSTAHGVTGLINLFGIESPGLTASLAIGEVVRDLAFSQTNSPILVGRRPRG